MNQVRRISGRTLGTDSEAILLASSKRVGEVKRGKMAPPANAADMNAAQAQPIPMLADFIGESFMWDRASWREQDPGRGAADPKSPQARNQGATQADRHSNRLVSPGFIPN